MICRDYPERLRRYKFENRITYKELGDLLGVSKTIARDIAEGKRVFVTLDTAKKLFGLLGEMDAKADVGR